MKNKKKTVLNSIRDDRQRLKIIVLGSAEKVLNGAEKCLNPTREHQITANRLKYM